MAPAYLWKPGQSGNPGGRPKRLDDVKELARSHTVDAIKRLAYRMNSRDSRASVAASQALLERAWGRPEQPLTGGDGEGGLTIIIRNVIEEKRLALANGQVIEHRAEEKKG